MKVNKLLTPRNIFTGLAIIGAGATVVCTHLDTKRELLKLADSEDGFISKKDRIINYIPTGVSLIVTETCIILSHRASAKEVATLTAGLAAVTKRFAEYRNTVKDENPDLDQKAIERFSKSPIDPQISTSPANGFRTPDVIKSAEFAELGDDTEMRLFYDDLTDTWFKATWLAVLSAEYDLNRNFSLGYPNISVGNFYEFLGVECPAKYKDLTWECEEFYDGYAWIDFSHIKCQTDDGREYYTIFYDFTPQPQED